MPNRILREGILTSERIALLNWQEEVFYRRLMSVVDDFGRYHANPKLLRAACYPLLIDKVSDADIGKWLTNCVTAALVSVYPALDGKRYLQLLDFRQQARADKSKFPPMPSECAADATQMPSTGEASAPVFGVGVVDEDVTPKAPKGADVRFEKFWQAFPSKVGKDAARKAFDKRKPDDALLAQMLSAIDAQRRSPKWLKDGGQFIPNPATWLNQGRWMDGADGDGGGEISHWYETRGGVDSKAIELGLPLWDGIENWLFFKARVIQATKEAA